MNPEQDNFRDLRRLLALKRHEQPPPGFFDNFSQEVLVRIRAGERIDDTSFEEVLSWEAPWLKRFLNLLDSKPILAGAFGAAVCGLLLAGVLYSEAPADTDTGGSMIVKVAPANPEEGLSPIAPASTAGPFFERAVPVKYSSMEGALPTQPRDSLFLQFNEARKFQMNSELMNAGGN